MDDRATHHELRKGGERKARNSAFEPTFGRHVTCNRRREFSCVRFYTSSDLGSYKMVGSATYM
jgi:hypothetical protein